MIQQILSGDYSSNCFLISYGRKALIDSGCTGDMLSKIIKTADMSGGIDILISTHCHFDHTGNNSKIKKAYNCDLYAHALDRDAISKNSRASLAYMFGEVYEPVEVDVELGDDDIIDLDGGSLKVIHTPGHTPGSISLYDSAQKALFSGDTLFIDGIGRTDFAGGSPGDMKRSLDKLSSFREKNTVSMLYPGHGRCGSEQVSFVRKFLGI